MKSKNSAETENRSFCLEDRRYYFVVKMVCGAK